MSTPNLEAMDHAWVSALMQFNFNLEYQKGCGNTLVDIFSWVTTQLNLDTVKSILNGVTLGMTQLRWKVTNAWNKKYGVLQATHWCRCMLPTGPKPRERNQCWAQCWTGWRHRSSQIWGNFSQNMLPVMKVNWSYRIDRISWFIRELCAYAQCPHVKLKTSCSSWSPRHTVLLLWMGATKKQAIKGMTTCCPCCENTSGGQEWLTRCKNSWSLACVACSMCPYTQLCPPLQWISAHRLYWHWDNHGAE